MNFHLQPTLENDLVRLQPIQTDDFERLYAVASDPQIWELHPAKDRYQRPVFEEFFKGAIDSKGAFLVTDKATEKVIGSSRFYNLHEKESDVEIGWTFLAKAYWGGQYNRAVKDLMLHHAFQYVDNVIFRVGDTNWRSRKAVEKIGGVLIEFDDFPHLEKQPNSVAYRLAKTGFNGLN